MEAIPLSDMSTATCAKALVSSWISHFVVSETITSNCGPQFTSNIWSQLCQMLPIFHRQTTAYHLESNGAVERLPCRLKDALCAHPAEATWADELPFVLLGLRAQKREDTRLSPAEAVYGTPINLAKWFFVRSWISVDSIVKKFHKTLDVPAFSLFRHNSSSQL